MPKKNGKSRMKFIDWNAMKSKKYIDTSAFKGKPISKKQRHRYGIEGRRK